MLLMLLFLSVLSHHSSLITVSRLCVRHKLFLSPVRYTHLSRKGRQERPLILVLYPCVTLSFASLRLCEIQSFFSRPFVALTQDAKIAKGERGRCGRGEARDRQGKQIFARGTLLRAVSLVTHWKREGIRVSLSPSLKGRGR